MRATRLFTSGLLLAGSVLAACGGDADESTATQPSVASATTAVAAPVSDTADTPAEATEAPVPTAGSAVETQPPVTAAAVETGIADCPDAAELSSLYGGEVELDEATAMTGAIGLVFCPYLEVLAPGATDEFGGEAFPDEFSLTFTDQNPVVPGGSEEEVAGLGEAASWSGLGELAVWTGDQGLIVSITFPPPAGDPKTVAIAIAQHVLA